MKDVTLYISSDVFNVANFLLFDLFLAAFIYSLTADLAGLENSKIAFREEKESFHFYNPPLVGVGITCTHRSVAYVLAVIRVASFFSHIFNCICRCWRGRARFFSTRLPNWLCSETFLSTRIIKASHPELSPAKAVKGGPIQQLTMDNC